MAAISITISTGNSARNIDALTASLERFGKAVTGAHTRLGTLNKKLANLNAVTSTMSPAMAKVAGKTEQLTSSYNKLNRQTSVAATATGAHKKSLMGLLPHVVAVTASYMAMRKMLRGVVAALKSAIDFEHRMTIVGAVSRATTEEMIALNQAARDAGESTVWTATEAATALKYLAMAGFTAEQSIGALGGVLQIAMIGEMELGRATDIVTDVLNSMQLQISDLSRVNDVFVGTITRSNTNIEQMGHAFQYVGPIAGELGYTLEEVSAMLGTLAQSGIKGGKAGRNLAQILVKNVDAARAFGVEGAKVNKVLKIMEEQEVGVTEMKKRFGMVSLKSALILRSHLSDYENFAETLKHVAGEADTLAKKVEKDLMNQFKLLRSAVDETTKSVFDLFKESLRNAIGNTTEAVRESKDAVVAFFEGMNDSIGPVISSVDHLVDSLGFIVNIVGGGKGGSMLVNAGAGAMLGFALAGPAGAAGGALVGGISSQFEVSLMDAIFKIIALLESIASGFAKAWGWLDRKINGGPNPISGGGNIPSPEFYGDSTKGLFDVTSAKGGVEALRSAIKDLNKEWLDTAKYFDIFDDATVSAKSFEGSLESLSTRLKLLKDPFLAQGQALDNYKDSLKGAYDEIEKLWGTARAKAWLAHMESLYKKDISNRKKAEEEMAAVMEEFRLDKLQREEDAFAESFRMLEDSLAKKKKAEEEMAAVMEEFRLDKLQREEDEFAASFAAFDEVAGKDGKMVKTAEEGFGAIGDLAESQLTAVFQGEFHSIGGFFKDMLNNMYSMFASWAAKITAKQIIIPMAMGALGPVASAFGASTAGAASGGFLSGMASGLSSNPLISGATSVAGSLFGGTQVGLASLLGNSSIGAISDLGMAIVGMNPLLFAGGMALGALGLGKVISGLFGKKKKNEPEFQVDFGLGFDASGNVTTSGIADPEHADYRGQYIWGRGPGTQFGDAAKTVDATIAEHLQPWLDTIQQINDALPEDLAASFRDAVGTIDFSWYAETHHPEDSLNDMLNQIDTLMSDSLGPVTDLFGQLATTLQQVTPAFDQLLGTLGQATGQYFGTLTGIDQQIIDAGGTNYLNDDLAWQSDTYKLLFDNAVANGSSQAFALGQQYANSLVGFSSATGVNITAELEQIRAQMLDVAGNPADFQESVLQTMRDFKEGVQESINAFTTAITELHPEIKLEMKVDLDIDEGGGYSYNYELGTAS